MNFPFENLPESSRIWVFQASRPFTSDDEPKLRDYLADFTSRWKVHGSPVAAGFDIRFAHFLILAADESQNPLSGCSIDESVRAVQEIEKMIGMKLLDRRQAAFLIDNKIQIFTASELKEKYIQGIWNEETPSFNNLITTKGQLETDWIIPAGKNWTKRFVPMRPVER